MEFHVLEEYFCNKLPQYEIIRVDRKPLSENLYMVAARKKNSEGQYACWTCWNAGRKSLDHGHYDLKNLSRIEEIFKKNCAGYQKPDFQGVLKERVGVRLVLLDGSEIVGNAMHVESGYISVRKEIPDEPGHVVHIVALEDLFSVMKL